MKRVGILTLYHNTINYGGSLQAYALCKCLLNEGYKPEQIAYVGEVSRKNQIKGVLSNNCKGLLYKTIQFAKKIILKPLVLCEEKKHNLYYRRHQAFSHFNKEVIPHTQEVYTKKTIRKTDSIFDAFIVGSDQVWNVAIADTAYFLDFVSANKLKMSYAASIARDSLTREEQKVFLDYLKDYKAVSVREKNAEKLLEGLSPFPLQTVLDPTLLLGRDDWDKVCATRQIPEEYVFCYFLGDNKKERKLALQFAKAKGWKLIALPHTSGIKLMDKKFGDERLYDVSPEQFLSLIKYSRYVFTDSFHAVVFSNIYQKQYFVFNRSKRGEMSSRIVNITELFCQEERFCAGDERETREYIISLPDIDYTQKNYDFERLREESIEFLKNNLKD